MDLPIIELNFLKRLKLLQLIKELDQHNNLQKELGDKSDTDKATPTWDIEKKVLYWSYLGHKHLGSPLKNGHFKKDTKESKLVDFLVSSEEVGKVKGKEVTVLENLKSKDFVSSVHTNGFTIYTITPTGLDMGAALWAFSKFQYSRKEEKAFLVLASRYTIASQLILYTSYVFYTGLALLLAIEITKAVGGDIMVTNILELYLSNPSLVSLDAVKTFIALTYISTAIIFGIGLLLMSGIGNSGKRKIKRQEKIKSKLFGKPQDVSDPKTTS